MIPVLVLAAVAESSLHREATRSFGQDLQDLALVVMAIVAEMTALVGLAGQPTRGQRSIVLLGTVAAGILVADRFFSAVFVDMRERYGDRRLVRWAPAAAAIVVVATLCACVLAVGLAIFT